MDSANVYIVVSSSSSVQELSFLTLFYDIPNFEISISLNISFFIIQILSFLLTIYLYIFKYRRYTSTIPAFKFPKDQKDNHNQVFHKKIFHKYKKRIQKLLLVNFCIIHLHHRISFQVIFSIHSTKAINPLKILINMINFINQIIYLMYFQQQHHKTKKEEFLV